MADEPPQARYRRGCGGSGAAGGTTGAGSRLRQRRERRFNRLDRIAAAGVVRRTADDRAHGRRRAPHGRGQAAASVGVPEATGDAILPGHDYTDAAADRGLTTEDLAADALEDAGLADTDPAPDR